MPSTIAYCTGELLLIEPAKKVLTNLPPLKKIYNPQGSGFILQLAGPPIIPRVDHVTNMVLKSHEMFDVYKQNRSFLQTIPNKIDVTRCMFHCDFAGISAINRGVWVEFFVTNSGLRNCFPLHDSHIGDPFHSIKTTLCEKGPFFF